jgi:hypothetical protein
LQMADGVEAGEVRVYRLGDWPSLFGIVLVLDRLSALMLVLTSVLGLAALVFSLARWHRAGAHFHPLFQFQLMGLNGAFLTGDIFQPVRVLRGDAGRLLRAGAAWAGNRTGQGRPALHRDQPDRLAALPGRRQHDLRRGRNPQHGRSRRAHSGRRC